MEWDIQIHKKKHMLYFPAADPSNLRHACSALSLVIIIQNYFYVLASENSIWNVSIEKSYILSSWKAYILMEFALIAITIGTM